MTSLQNSAGAGKAAKFVQANPLAPMADPFAGMVRSFSIFDFVSKFIVICVSFGFETFAIIHFNLKMTMVNTSISHLNHHGLILSS